MTEKLDITQADRDAAAMVYGHFRDHDYAGWIRCGTNAGGDYNPIIQAFARHRLASPDEGAIVSAMFGTVSRAIADIAPAQTLPEAVKAGLASWNGLPEDERNGERPWIMGWNAGYEHAQEELASPPLPKDREIVERLRAVVPYQGKSTVAFLCHEAADRIEALIKAPPHE